ncbi:Gldg family protein [Treponema sp.]|uniref:Gldg family protein n=1 Tax=Treponema sp. TaxID=166 RepID=UPI00388FB42D
MNRLIHRFLHKICHTTSSYIASIVYITYIALQWFIGQRFFAGMGTTDLHRFFAAFPFAFIVYVPLLVSVSKIRRQWSFPYSTSYIALGWILSVFLVALASTMLTASVPLAVTAFGDIEWSQFFSGYFGILLFMLCAIGFTALVFTLIKSTAVGFVVSVIGLALCNSIHNIPLYIDPGKLTSFIIKSISFAWNFDSFAKGILDLKQILYFMLASILFYSLILYSVEKRKGNSNENFRKASKVITSTFLILCALTSFINVKFDLTRAKKFSITEYTKQIVSKVTEPVTITYYLSPSLKNLYPQVKDVTDYLEAFSSTSSLISFKIINPSTQELQRRLADHGINGQPVRTNSVSSSTVTKVYSAVVMDYLGMTETIPFVLAASTLEFDLAQKLNSLVEEKKNLVQIVCANDLSIENDYSYMVPYLKSLGYVPFVSELPSSSTDDDRSFISFPTVPLIVLGSERFTRKDSKCLEEFILKGGKAFIATQPYSVNLKDDWSIRQTEEQLYFQRILFTFGIYFKNTLTCDISNFRLTMVSDTGTNGNPAEKNTEYLNYSLWPVIRPQVFAPDGMTTFWPCAFDIDNDVADMENLAVSPILTTSTGSWQMEKIDEKFITSPFVCPKTPAENELKGEFTIAAAVSKKDNPEDIELILLGDQYALSTPMISYSSSDAMDFRSMEFLGNSLLLLSGEKDLLALKNKSTFNHSLYKISEQEIEEAVRKTFFITIILPILMIIGAGLYSAYRRRKHFR